MPCNPRPKRAKIQSPIKNTKEAMSTVHIEMFNKTKLVPDAKEFVKDLKLSESSAKVSKFFES